MWRARFKAVAIILWCFGQLPVRLRDKILAWGDINRLIS